MLERSRGFSCFKGGFESFLGLGLVLELKEDGKFSFPAEMRKGFGLEEEGGDVMLGDLRERPLMRIKKLIVIFQ